LIFGDAVEGDAREVAAAHAELAIQAARGQLALQSGAPALPLVLLCGPNTEYLHPVGGTELMVE